MSNNFEHIFLGIYKMPTCVNKKEVDGFIKQIDKLPFMKDPSKPSYQKWFDIKDTVLLKSFVQGCKQYLNYLPNEYKISSWVHVTNNKCVKKTDVYHVHNPNRAYALSGILYLNIPEKSSHTKFICDNKEFLLPKEPYCWFIFPSNLPHIPGVNKDRQKRYCLSADFWF